MVSLVFRLSSSLREAPLEATLTRARELAEQLGITRVTEITRLDVVGVPVFASIRPDALPGSLCVNAGKGMSVDEARVGAYMEAIEFALAEFDRSALEIRTVPASEVFEGPERSDSILDFCPTMGTEIDLDAPISCVEALDVRTGEAFLVPCELVYLPFPESLQSERYFSSNSNGLCSGNSVREATVHGLAELIERDCSSFMFMDDQSKLVDGDTLPPQLRAVAESVHKAGLELYLRFQANVFGIPFFRATVAEPNSINPVYISDGFGCNLSKNIAATRAICEALQSRLSFIHGGRDDLVKRYELFAKMSDSKRTDYAERLQRDVSRQDVIVDFETIPDSSNSATDLSAALQVMLEMLERNGIRRVLRVIFTSPEDPLQVMRVLAPGLECFNPTTARLGVRLRDYVRDKL
jgi:ribosomal protein S12 methylthiotransferase accessory factor